jgi:hypothetical protein
MGADWVPEEVDAAPERSRVPMGMMHGVDEWQVRARAVMEDLLACEVMKRMISVGRANVPKPDEARIGASSIVKRRVSHCFVRATIVASLIGQSRLDVLEQQLCCVCFSQRAVGGSRCFGGREVTAVASLSDISLATIRLISGESGCRRKTK